MVLKFFIRGPLNGPLVSVVIYNINFQIVLDPDNLLVFSLNAWGFFSQKLCVWHAWSVVHVGLLSPLHNLCLC